MGIEARGFLEFRARMHAMECAKSKTHTVAKSLNNQLFRVRSRR